MKYTNWELVKTILSDLIWWRIQYPISIYFLDPCIDIIIGSYLIWSGDIALVPFSFHNVTLNFTSRLQSTYFTIQRKFNPDLELLFTSAMCVNQPSLKPSNHRIKISVWTMTRPTWCSDSSGSRNTSSRVPDYSSGKAEPREWEESLKSFPTNKYKTDDKKFPGYEKIPGN